jgi:ankyrin repeat protein
VSDIAAFFKAVQSGDASKVGALLDADASLANLKNEKGQSPVLMAVYTGRKEIRDLFLARGISLELHEAAAAGQLARVKQIVEKDSALTKSYSPDGFPVFALPAAFGHLEVAEYLLGKGADVNAAATNGTGYNALTGAVASGHTAIVAWLLANGADPNYRYGAGYSPLLTAAANGHLGIVSILLASGADLHAKTNDGKTALKFAEERNHTEVAEFLRSQGAA